MARGVEPILERMPRLRPVISGPRKTDHGVVPDDAQAASKPRKKTKGCKSACCRGNISEFSSAGLKEPEPTTMEARRLRHRELAEHDLSACHFHDKAAGLPVFAPTLRALLDPRKVT